MKLNFLNWNVNVWALAALVGMGSLSSCSSDDDGMGDGGDTGEIVVDNGATLSGIVTKGQTVILKEGRSFKLSGGYTVEDGGLLKIEPGVTIEAVEDDIVDFILVKMGGKIDAQGTADSPIIMTAQLKESKAWGGIHICGKAHTNKGTGTKSEIGDASYGSGASTANDNDNSGTLRYIRLEYTGYAFTKEKESNGLTCYAVGSGTTIDHIQAYKGADDGFEFFGGSVNVKYLVATDCEDDSFDWTEGWNGKGQFLVADQRGTSGVKDDGDCLIEADNNGDDNAASPVAHPILANMTLIGNSSSEGSRGIRLREGTEAEIYNSIVTGKPKSLTVETEITENALKDGKSKLQYVVLGQAFSSNEGIYTEDLFLAEANKNQVNSANIPAFADNSFVGVIDGAVKLSDSFFTETDYTGAVKDGDSNWGIGKAWIRK